MIETPHLPACLQRRREERKREEERGPQIGCSAAAIVCSVHSSALLKLAVCLASQILKVRRTPRGGSGDREGETEKWNHTLHRLLDREKPSDLSESLDTAHRRHDPVRSQVRSVAHLRSPRGWWVSCTAVVDGSRSSIQWLGSGGAHYLASRRCHRPCSNHQVRRCTGAPPPPPPP